MNAFDIIMPLYSQILIVTTPNSNYHGARIHLHIKNHINISDSALTAKIALYIVCHSVPLPFQIFN